MIEIDMEKVYGKPATAKLADLPRYLEIIAGIAGEGNEVMLTGSAPIWLYLKTAHFLHGKVKRLMYYSPALEPNIKKDEGILIFDHDPF